ncbi:hypothetical protein NP493_2565g00008 [Ridgeia piscesae]|uniref:VWFA domain-containing protein n=1 Tax=Ridgeia piscesae TaxID=27915 RepID=A0AAD9JEP3_RIDPI|nr:hypothetical protein NP493_2565g00008 [Ridgeia piscesae]
MDFEGDPFRGVSWSECSALCGPDGERTRSAAGQEQKIRCNTQSCEPRDGDCIGDVVFVLDSSGSIGFLNWSVSTQFVIDVMKGLKISSEGTHVSVVIYSTEVETCFGLDTYHSVDDIEPIVFNLEYMAGVTNTADGIMVMHQILKDQGRGSNIATPIGVVITDGVSNVDESRTILEAKAARDDGIQMFAIAIGQGINMDEVKGIANNEDYVFHAADYGQVQDMTDEIASKICSKGNTEVCGDCGDFSDCNADCGIEGIMEGTRDCWLVSGVTGQEIPSSRKKVPCSDKCLVPCPVEECGPCGEYGPCSESCGEEGTRKTTKDCWLNDGTTREEMDGTRKQVPCTETCLIPCPVRECGPCGEYGPCSESCGEEGTRETTKDCWLNDGTTGEEIDGTREQEPCVETCLIPCPVPECGPCGEYGPCSESCGEEGTRETTKDCWLNDGTTGEEMDGTRKQVPCTETCLIPCPVRECGPCGEYGPCSESCGEEGTRETTKDCWLNDGTTGEEIDGTREQEPCTETCLIPCPVRECGPCGEYGPCSESCGEEGTRETTKDCWLNDGTTGEEIDGTREQEPCVETCLIPCPVRECGPCGEYGPCSESCGEEGTRETTKDCWLNDGTTGEEIDGTREQEPCTETCLIPCPVRECGPCGEYGPCSESCGEEGTRETTKDCWLNDGTTGEEIDGTREQEPCTETCLIPCPVRECGPCGEYGPCSESCGEEGTRETTKDCWLNDGTTGEEIDGTREQEPCVETCLIPCPVRECGPCGEYGPCSESCGEEGTRETTKDCWLNDGTTGEEIDGTREQEPCVETCLIPCPVPECGPCGEYGPCSESCGEEGTRETTKDCWLNDGTTGEEIDGTREQEPCVETCLIPCPVRECGPCGEYGPCSESCGEEGTRETTKDCWLNDGTTGEEIDGTREQEPCVETCLIPCPVRECGPCGEYGPCSESCGEEGTRETTKDCWLNDGTTGEEIDGTREQEPCVETCLIPCPVRECGPCGEYGPCSESCGEEGTRETTKDCWLNDGTTGEEIDGTREQEPCVETCLIPCPVRECGPCGEYGPCSESCGEEGTRETTKDCWLNDGTTGEEIDGTREQEPCTETCLIPCPVRECGPCGEYGPCSESCGEEGTRETTKDCWLNDGTTGEEIDGTREQEPCVETCLIPCPVRECGPCGEYGPCSESCGEEGTRETTKDCWLNDGTTGEEIDGTREQEPCVETCLIPCPVRNGTLWRIRSMQRVCGEEGTRETTKDCWLNDGTTGEEIDGTRSRPC